MGKFKDAIGKMTIDVGKIYFEFVPTMEDMETFLSALRGVQAKKEDLEEGNLPIEGIKKLTSVMSDIIHKYNSEEPIQDIKDWASQNFSELTNQFMVGFKLTTKERIEELKKKDSNQENHNP